MDTVTTLIIFSAIFAAVCVKARAAVPALLAGAFALVLFCTTPIGSGLPGALGDAVGTVGEVGSQVAQVGAER